MTMAEGMLRPEALSVREGRLAVSVHLPWYRSLPISCLESVDVTVDGVRTQVRSVRVPGFAGTVADAADSDATWDLRDPLVVWLDAAGRLDVPRALDVAVAVRIPYIQQAPGVPLVQRAVAQAEGTPR